MPPRAGGLRLDGAKVSEQPEVYVVELPLFGIPVRIASTALVMVGIYVLFGIQRREHPLVIAGYIAIVFGSVLVHELGHALAKLYFKLGPVRITLHGFGGLTEGRAADRPWKNLIVELAGPFSGLALGAVGVALLFAPWWGPAMLSLIGSLIFFNFFWSAFNLLPLFPMDGGHALKSILMMFAPKHAWNVTTIVGMVGGCLLLAALGISMLMGRPLGGFLMIFLVANIIQQNFQRRSELGLSNPF